MIPRRAFFFWDGEEMSWLRKQSIETFKALNPTWEVEILDGTNIPIKGKSRLARVGRSDWGRYKALLDKGGVYFDSDIMFCRAIPDSWLEYDMVLPLVGDADTDPTPEGPIGHVACLGAEAGNKWAALLDELCAALAGSGENLQYQALGMMIVNKCVSALDGYKVCWIIKETFIPIIWSASDHLWRSGVQRVHLSPLTYGVHWFGGDWTAMALEDEIDEAWIMESNCIVAQAWKMAMGVK